MLDIAIIGGLVVDGTGDTPRQTDVGIKNGRIVEVAKGLSTEAIITHRRHT